VYVLEN